MAGQLGFDATVGALGTCVADATGRWGAAERAGSRNVIRTRTFTRTTAWIGGILAANGASNRCNVVIDVGGKGHVAVQFMYI